MESSEISGWLPDVNVWLSLCSDRHEHHGVASNGLAAIREPVYFCGAWLDSAWGVPILVMR